MTTATKTKTTKISIDKEVFLSKLLRLAKYIPKKPIIPIQSFFHISVEQNKMSMISSNSDVTATIKLDVICPDKVAICVPGRLLFETVKLFRESEVVIESKANHKIVLKCGKSKYNISGVDPNDFPLPKYPSCEYEISLDSKSFRDSIATTEKFTLTEGIETQFLGISISEVNKEMVFIGTNKHVMAKNVIKPKAIKDWSNIILPRKTAIAFSDIVEGKDIIDIYHNGKNVIAQSFDMTIVSTLIDNKFPNTDTFFNKQNPANVILHTMEIKDAMDRLKLYTSEDSSTIVMTIYGSTLEIYAEDMFNSHSGLETISLKQPSAADIRIGFSVEYFLEILNTISETEFMFSFSDEKTMAFIKAIPGEGETTDKNFVILPCLVQGK